MVAPHGIKGEVSAQPLRGLPFILRPGMTVALTPPALKRDRFCTIESADAASGLTKFSGIDDLDAAESISGCYVLARADEVELGPLEVPYDDLVGRTVTDSARGPIGTLAEVMETPANDVWVVRGDRYGEVLVPVIDQVVDSIPDEGPIRVTLLAGLIDDAEGDAC